MNANALARGPEIGRSSERLRDDERLAVEEDRFLPDGRIDEGMDVEVADGVLYGFDGFDVFGDPIHPIGDVKGYVVPFCERPGVAFVSVEKEHHAGDVAELLESLVDAVGVDRVDDPDSILAPERVGCPLHRLRRVSEPADPIVEAVDFLEGGRSTVGTCHTLSEGSHPHKGRTPTFPRTTVMSIGSTLLSMLGACRWLALEVEAIDPVAEFYRTHFDLETVRTDEREHVLNAGGESSLILRRPTGVPRGGLHTHYAFACPEDTYDGWYERLDGIFDLVEVDFGSMRSLYLDDPEGNCVEIASATPPVGDGDSTLTGIFEVVFEVESLPDAEAFYVDLGFDVVDRGEGRQRTRLTNGPFDVELWEPHLGLADARGGVHVDVGIVADDPERAADMVAARSMRRDRVDDGVRIRDPDGHYLTLVESGDG